MQHDPSNIKPSILSLIPLFLDYVQIISEDPDNCYYVKHSKPNGNEGRVQIASNDDNQVDHAYITRVADSLNVTVDYIYSRCEYLTTLAKKMST